MNDHFMDSYEIMIMMVTISSKKNLKKFQNDDPLTSYNPMIPYNSIRYLMQRLVSDISYMYTGNTNHYKTIIVENISHFASSYHAMM